MCACALMKKGPAIDVSMVNKGHRRWQLPGPAATVNHACVSMSSQIESSASTNDSDMCVVACLGRRRLENAHLVQKHRRKACNASDRKIDATRQLHMMRECASTNDVCEAKEVADAPEVLANEILHYARGFARAASAFVALI